MKPQGGRRIEVPSLIGLWDRSATGLKVRATAKRRQQCGVGLDAEKYLWPSGREKCFLLDIPFNRTSEHLLGLLGSTPIPPSSSLRAFPFN
jgi:hypothetical protein